MHGNVVIITRSWTSTQDSSKISYFMSVLMVCWCFIVHSTNQHIKPNQGQLLSILFPACISSCDVNPIQYYFHGGQIICYQCSVISISEFCKVSSFYFYTHVLNVCLSHDQMAMNKSSIYYFKGEGGRDNQLHPNI